MKIVVLVKQVPNPSHVRLDPETKRMVREGVPLELNEFDVYAVTEAIRLREEHGGEVVTMTMGPPQAEDALRMTLAMGADRAIHLNDKVFAVADTLGTSRTLALAVAKEGADLVICGRKTVDSGDLAGAARDRRFPRLATADQRRPARARGRKPATAGDRRGVRHVGARDSRSRLGRRGDQRRDLARSQGRRRDVDRGPHRDLDGR